MHRYWVFAGTNYYPSGGAYDLHSTIYDDKEEAIEYARKRIDTVMEETPTRMGGDSIDWVHVLDTVEMDVVFSIPEH